MKKVSKNNVIGKTTYLSASDCKCPKCGSTNIQGVSRITGYLSLDERFGGGKVKERAARRNHTSEDHSFVYSKIKN